MDPSWVGDFHGATELNIRSLQRAFYQGGVDMSMADVALCPAVPILLFGALDEAWDTNGRCGRLIV